MKLSAVLLMHPPASIPIRNSVAAIAMSLFLGLVWRAQAQTCVGDCNSDGEVTLGEVQLAFNIFLGTALAETCAGFDTGVDGEVSLGEVQVSFTQFLGSCQGDVTATPTLPGTATPTPTHTPTFTATATPTLGRAAVLLGEIGAPGLPGGTATVSFDFTSQEGRAAAIAFDVVFDATFVNLDTDDCQLSSRLADQIRSVTFPSAEQPASPHRRVRLGVFPPIREPIPSFADGEVFVCTFGVGAGAPVSQSVTLVVEPLQVTRADSSVVCGIGECGSVHGSISIQ